MGIKAVYWNSDEWPRTFKRAGRYWQSSPEAYRRVGLGHWLDSKNRWHTCYLVYVDWGERWLVDSEDCGACSILFSIAA